MSKSTNPAPRYIDETSSQLVTTRDVGEMLGLAPNEYGDSLVRMLADRQSEADFPRSFKVAEQALWLRHEIIEWQSEHDLRWEIQDLGDRLLIISGRLPEESSSTKSTGPIPCQPWCQYGEGVDAPFVEDQRCYSEPLRLNLTLHPEIPESWYDARGGWRRGPDYLSVYAVHSPTQGTELNIQRNEGHELRFSLDEASELVETLELVLGQVAKATRK